MGANREWREAHPTAKLVKGYEMRYRVEGERWTQRKHGWGVDGELPPEWEETKTEPEVTEAVIYPAYQRHWKPDKRRIIDQHKKGQSGT
jgi:hypothetical protein